MRNRLSVLLATQLATALAAAACGGEAAPKPPPNVVLLLIDTARADHLPCYGYERDTMPRTCGFAADAVTFTNARSVAPWTLPAHASLFTGVPPGEHGLHWGHPSVGSADPMQVRQPQALLAERLRARGYTTVGVSNNPWVGRSSSLDLGFDHFVEVWDSKSWPAPWKAAGLADAQPAEQGVAIAKNLFAEREVKPPYFLFVSMIEPHMPYSPAEDLLGTFGGDTALRDLMVERRGALELDLLAGAAAEEPTRLAALYDEELATVDRAVGHLLDWLNERGDYDDALVIVTSDHGEHLGEAGRYSHQFSMAPELLWIPLLVKFPGSGSRNVWGAQGERDERRVSLLDVYATVLAASGATPGSADSRWARDLGESQDWPPRLTLAESYFSERYVGAVARRSNAFDADAHRVVRRTWFSQDERFDFADSESSGVTTKSATDAERERAVPERDHDRAVEQERAYADALSQLGPPGLGERRVPEGGQMVQELKALGYVE